MDSDADDEEESEEAKELKYTCMPCAEEVRIHDLTHLPFRDWCPFCVKGRAVSMPHRTAEKEHAITVIGMDYMGLNHREPGEDACPIIVAVDEKSGTLLAHVLLQKGVEPFAVKTLVSDFRDILGYTKFIIKTDQEPAILALKNAVAKEMTSGQGDAKQILMEESPVGGKVKAMG